MYQIVWGEWSSAAMVASPVSKPGGSRSTPVACSCLRPEQLALTSFGPVLFLLLIMNPSNLSAVAVVRHTLPVRGKARHGHLRPAEVGNRIRGTTLVVGTGGAVRPLTLYLSAQGPSVDLRRSHQPSTV
jgi:hypothetical protein